MAAVFSAIPTSKIPSFEMGFSRITLCATKRPNFPQFNRINPKLAVENPPSSSSCACNSATISNSLTLDHDSINDEELKKAESIIGLKVRVKVQLKVYHVPKLPEFELLDKIGVLKQYVGVHKGKKISANLPYKVEFVADEVTGRDGKPVKFTAHLREDEFEILD